MGINLKDDELVTLTADGLSKGGNTANDTYTWSCSPSDTLYFREGGNTTASGRVVTLVARGPVGSGSVLVTDAESFSATETVTVVAGPDVSLSIQVGTPAKQ
jgi:hypothetical protein